MDLLKKVCVASAGIAMGVSCTHTDLPFGEEVEVTAPIASYLSIGDKAIEVPIEARDGLDGQSSGQAAEIVALRKALVMAARTGIAGAIEVDVLAGATKVQVEDISMVFVCNAGAVAVPTVEGVAKQSVFGLQESVNNLAQSYALTESGLAMAGIGTVPPGETSDDDSDDTSGTTDDGTTDDGTAADDATTAAAGATDGNKAGASTKAVVVSSTSQPTGTATAQAGPATTEPVPKTRTSSTASGAQGSTGNTDPIPVLNSVDLLGAAAEIYEALNISPTADYAVSTIGCVPKGALLAEATSIHKKVEIPSPNSKLSSDQSAPTGVDNGTPGGGGLAAGTTEVPVNSGEAFQVGQAHAAGTPQR